MHYGKLALSLAALGALVGSATGSAQAQGREVIAASGAQALSMPPPPSGALLDDTSEERDPTPMNGIGVGFKLGVAGIGAGELDIVRNGKTYPGRIENRHGLYLAIPIHVGGDGFGWSFEPYLSKATIEHSVLNASGQWEDDGDASLMAYGLYTGPTVNIHVLQPLYLGVGVGVKAAYVASNVFEYAVDAYGRVPLSATYYLANQVALVAEFGLGYGVSAYVDKPVSLTNPRTGKVTKVEDSGQYGKSLTWDCSIGVRLP